MGKKKANVDRSICVECKGHVPPYLNFLCEKCWNEALKDKLDKEWQNGKDSSRH